MKNTIIKFGAIFILVISILVFSAGFVFASEPVKGDVNGDGLINKLDVKLLEQILVRQQPIVESADVNKDGKISILDVADLEYIIVKMNWGDANQDNETNMADVITVEKMLLKMIPLTPEADANKDYKISLLDAVTIELMILKQD